MENVVLVGLSGGNSMFLPIGAFASLAEAEQALLGAGAIRKRFEKKRYNETTKKYEGTGEFGKEYIVVTEAFKDWMDKHDFSFYSVGGACDVDADFMFETFPLGIISHGYDDD